MIKSYKELREEFIVKRGLNGQQEYHVLNKVKLSERELDQIFNTWQYEA